MYELELAFMVIAHSQRDPGEHMLQLQQFAAQPEGPLRKHALDMHLGRWRHALSDLLNAGPQQFEQALALASDKVRNMSSLLLLAPAQLIDHLGLPGTMIGTVTKGDPGMLTLSRPSYMASMHLLRASFCLSGAHR